MFKRLFDITVSAVALSLLSPVLLGIALAVRISMGSPILFRQVRPGRDAKLFEIYKFRTMRTGPGSDTDRLTSVGRILRGLSLDELPQFVNVLKGDMSLIGPRPLPSQYLDRYTPTQARRHEVRPGLTGLAQVRGRNSLGWEERFLLDVAYVDNRSMLFDLRIAFETVGVVLRRSGVSAPGHETMPEFKVPVSSADNQRVRELASQDVRAA